MRCRSARWLCNEQSTALLSASQRAALAEHLDSCPSCRAFAERADRLESALKDDASVAAQVTFSESFDERLRAALASEADFGRIDRTMRPQLLSRLRSALALAGAGVAIFVLMCLALLQPAPRAPEYRFSPISAFTTRSAEDGRVFASLTGGNAVGRITQREAYLQ